MIRFSFYRAIFFIIIFTLNQFCLANEIQKVTVYVLSSNSEISAIEKNVVDVLRNECETQNLLDDSSANWDLLIAAEELESNLIAISVTILQSMPKEVIEAGSNSQIFYAFLEKSKSLEDPEKNQEVRKYVTSEFLSNFKQAVESEIIITKNENIEDTCSKIVDSFVKKYL
jgi:hypothetical protein